MRKSARTQIPPFFDNDPYSPYFAVGPDFLEENIFYVNKK